MTHRLRLAAPLLAALLPVLLAGSGGEPAAETWGPEPAAPATSRGEPAAETWGPEPAAPATSGGEPAAETWGPEPAAPATSGGEPAAETWGPEAAAPAAGNAKAAGATGAQAAAPAPDTVVDLRDLFAAGLFVDDRNGDSLPDFVDGRIVLAAESTPAEAGAAADLAARLGYETTATDLGRAARIGDPVAGPVLLVGDEAAGSAGIDAAAVRSTLAPGQGALSRVGPSPAYPFGGVALVGYDATGLLAASAYLAGRYPAVWGVDGSTWASLSAAADTFAAVASPDLAPRLTRIVVDAARPGVARAEMAVAASDAAARGALLAALAGEPADTTADDSDADDPLQPLRIRDLHRLEWHVVGAGADTVVAVRPEEPWSPSNGSAYRPPSTPPFSLVDLYTVDGLYRDTNQDLVPDESRASLSLASGAVADGVVDLATRIGLETAGIRLPLARVGGQEDDPTARGFPILVGPGHHARRALAADGGMPGDDGAPGTGFALLLDRSFGLGEPEERRGGLVVDGADADGVSAALDWLAGRAPYLWSHGKGQVRLADLQTEIRRFLQARKAPGQVALALAKLGTWMDRDAESGAAPRRVEVELVAEDAPEGLAAVAEATIRERFTDADIAVDTWSSGFGQGDTIFVQEWAIPWEVDDARARLEAEVYPAVRPGAPASVELRVSEPPAIRARLADEIRTRLAEAGADPVDVHVFSAYKQGYSWLEDRVLPELREVDAERIEITYHTLDESDEIRWQTIAADTRWLQELYPVDAVLARELALSDSAITFTPTRTADPIYTVTARNAAGTVVFEDAFTPRYVVRPFFDLFPEYEQVRVTTGWLHAAIGGETVLDERVVTDPERFWDRLQTETYAEIVDYVLDTQDGAPSPANAPFFDEFHIDLRLSEPDYRIGVDEEVISSLEALHEDIYFETLTLFDLIGSRYQTSQPYPGRVLPWIDPSGAGQPGQARLSLNGKERAGAELLVRTWTDDAAAPRVRRYGLGPLPVDPPRIVGVGVDAGADGLRTLVARVEVPDSVDRFREFEGRSSEAGIDAQFMNAELLDAMVAALRTLHAAGLFTDALSWDRVAELVIDVRVEDAPGAGRRAGVPRSPNPASTDAPRLVADGWSGDGSPLVQWDTPIPPAENDTVLARLATFPQATVYHMTNSFLGQPIWAVDLLPPHDAGYVSQAKLNALKPTLFISGRQHANEVSSTSHILRLAELLVTDSSYTALLDDVNVVLHPITNPDGARLAVEMQEVTPDFMLHAGYLGALGVDATSGERDDDALYPESQVRRRIRETWLPDVYINMHGYPSHEWVQYFAGYSAWVRSRRGGQRSWWAPRGWFIPGLSIVEDDDEAEYGDAQWAVLDSIAAAITGEPEVEAMNRRLYARYRKYGVQDRDDFTEFFHEGILVNLRPRGPQSIGQGLYSPRITWFSTTTEAPDETARGDWLELVATAGLAHSSALLRYLAGGTFEMEREVEADAGGVVRKASRVKPVLPGG